MFFLLAWTSIGVAVLCALVIALDECRHPQKMAIMNIVWPVTALYFSIFALLAYVSIGRKKAAAAMPSMGADRDPGAGPAAAEVALGTGHCGAGCMIADVISEFAIAAFGITLFGSMLWASYIIDFIAAWLLGIVFQYFAIKPMRPELTVSSAVTTAIKADSLSILAFQVGMYLWMALVHFKLFASAHLTPFDPRYWLMMQVAMICGFATSFPMNRMLLARGIKEKM